MPMVGVRGELLLNGYILDESPIRAPIPSSTPMGLCVEVINATNLKPVDYPVVVTKTSSNDFIDLVRLFTHISKGMSLFHRHDVVFYPLRTNIPDGCSDSADS